MSLPSRDQISVEIVESDFGYYAHFTHGIANVEPPLFSFSRKRLQRKIDRRVARLREEDRRHDAAERIVYPAESSADTYRRLKPGKASEKGIG